ncbi:Rap1a/Tai family immunity protein [Hydrogenophaga crocea]|uniref:Rap1a immunity protein domain-containing protein n=1 Tax=Hydrogenophaga crocea TaxID=2716225 RepID=A0A6G8IEV8_9BURK|nr:Rap1a/Tai family immunity protein [Hydrogenophaga crocea]QIM51598.1 hypothetical protein G9Q37_05320 [Hydrogenophaga crocea]
MKRAALLGLIVAAGQSWALTGNQVLELMPADRDGDLLLSTYARGLLDAETLVRVNGISAARAGAQYAPSFCTPKGASVSQAAAIVRKELLSAPENNHQDIAVIARRSLLKAWPCDDSWIKRD